MDLNTEDALYKVAINMVPGLGSTGIKKIVKDCGSERQFFENLDDWAAQGIITSSVYQSAKNSNALELAKAQLDTCSQHHINILYYQENSFPRKLIACHDHPTLLYTLGTQYNFDAMRTIGIVGTRMADTDAKNNIFNLIQKLKEDNINIMVISGLASGADTYAHQASLQYGVPTTAVLGHGLNMVYPADNRKLAGDIVHSNGLLMTEYYYGSRVSKTNFPRRNRIIAGLCDAIIVAQSKIKGGALITAEDAIDYKKSVFAFPGRASDKLYAGCNLLISRNKATLISNADDLEYSMGWSKGTSDATQTSLNMEPLSPEEAKVLDILRQNGTMIIDIISAKTGIPIFKLSSLLLLMEFKDLVRSHPGKQFEANGAINWTKDMFKNLGK